MELYTFRRISKGSNPSCQARNGNCLQRVVQTAFKKRVHGHPDLEAKFWERVKIFLDDPRDARLRTHKLSGSLRELWSFTVEYDFRIVFMFAEPNRAVFVDIGKHDDVY